MKTVYLTALILILQGCGKNNSIMISQEADINAINQGVVYSLPKQFVKATYTKRIYSKEDIFNKISELHVKGKTLKTALAVKTKEVSDIDFLIKNVDTTNSQAAAVLAKYNQEKLKLLASKLLLTYQLKEVNETTKEYKAKVIGADTITVENFKIKALPPQADHQNTFVAKHNHTGRHSEEFTLNVIDGLLDGAIGNSNDDTSEIISTFTGSVSAAQTHSISNNLITAHEANDPPTPDQCKAKKNATYTYVIDPDDDNYSGNRELRKMLNKECRDFEIAGLADKKISLAKKAHTSKGNRDLELFIKKYPDNKPEDCDCEDKQERPITFNGLLYRMKGPYQFTLKEHCGYTDCGKSKPCSNKISFEPIHLSLAQGGNIGLIPLPKGKFANNQFDVDFNKGMLVKSKITKPSEILGFARILPNTLREIIAIPTELIQLRVDYSSHEKTLLELNKQMLIEQIAIINQQNNLDALINEEPTIPDGSPTVLPQGESSQN